MYSTIDVSSILNIIYIRFSSWKLCFFSSRFLFCLKMSRDRHPRFHSPDYTGGDHRPLQIHLLDIPHWTQGEDVGQWDTREPRQWRAMRTPGEPGIAAGQSLSYPNCSNTTEGRAGSDHRIELNSQRQLVHIREFRANKLYKYYINII